MSSQRVGHESIDLRVACALKMRIDVRDDCRIVVQRKNILELAFGASSALVNWYRHDDAHIGRVLAASRGGGRVRLAHRVEQEAIGPGRARVRDAKER